MPAARYWRVVGIETYGGGDLELSAFQLYSLSGDPNFGSVGLLLHGGGADNSTTFTDSAGVPNTISGFGNAKISTTQSKFGGASIALDGASYLTTPSSSVFDFASDDFTVECWVYPTATPSTLADIISTNRATAPGNGWSLRLRPSMVPIAGLSTDGSDYVGLEGTIAISMNSWSHLALVRAGTRAMLYVNGVLSVEVTFSGSQFNTTGDVNIGRNAANSSWFFTGFLDDVRTTKGVGRYSSDFIPPTEAFADSLSGESVRQDATASLTSSVAPISGVVTNLQDGNLATTARFNPKPAGFTLQWDFGSGNSADIVLGGVGSSASQSMFLSHFTLQYSSDGQLWTTLKTQGRFDWPGPNALTPTVGGVIPIPVTVKPNTNLGSFWREAIPGSVGAATTNSATPVRDIYTAGRGQIVATVKEDGTPDDTPVRRKVRLFRDRDGLFVRETWSNATTGAYSFTEIDENETYSVVSYDHNDNFRAVIADRIAPTVA